MTLRKKKLSAKDRINRIGNKVLNAVYQNYHFLNKKEK